MIEILKWKSFTLVANVDNENDDDVQNIAKKLTINAIANNLCVIIHDNDEEGMKYYTFSFFLYIFLLAPYFLTTYSNK